MGKPECCRIQPGQHQSRSSEGSVSLLIGKAEEMMSYFPRAALILQGRFCYRDRFVSFLNKYTGSAVKTWGQLPANIMRTVYKS